VILLIFKCRQQQLAHSSSHLILSPPIMMRALCIDPAHLLVRAGGGGSHCAHFLVWPFWLTGQCYNVMRKQSGSPRQHILSVYSHSFRQTNTGVLRVHGSNVPAAPPIRLPIPNPNPNPSPNPKTHPNRNPILTLTQTLKNKRK